MPLAEATNAIGVQAPNAHNTIIATAREASCASATGRDRRTSWAPSARLEHRGPVEHRLHECRSRAAAGPGLPGLRGLRRRRGPLVALGFQARELPRPVRVHCAARWPPPAVARPKIARRRVAEDWLFHTAIANFRADPPRPPVSCHYPGIRPRHGRRGYAPAGRGRFPTSTRLSGGAT